MNKNDTGDSGLGPKLGDCVGVGFQKRSGRFEGIFGMVPFTRVEPGVPLTIRPLDRAEIE